MLSHHDIFILLRCKQLAYWVRREREYYPSTEDLWLLTGFSLIWKENPCPDDLIYRAANMTEDDLAFLIGCLSRFLPNGTYPD